MTLLDLWSTRAFLPQSRIKGTEGEGAKRAIARGLKKENLALSLVFFFQLRHNFWKFLINNRNIEKKKKPVIHIEYIFIQRLSK